jgi:hypothetical protein
MSSATCRYGQRGDAQQHYEQHSEALLLEGFNDAADSLVALRVEPA